MPIGRIVVISGSIVPTFIPAAIETPKRAILSAHPDIDRIALYVHAPAVWATLVFHTYLATWTFVFAMQPVDVPKNTTYSPGSVTNRFFHSKMLVLRSAGGSLTVSKPLGP